MKPIWLIIVFLLLFIIPSLASAEPWWNTSWNYRQQINITNNNFTQTLEQNYTINITFNHSQLVSAGKSLASGNDTRIIWYNSSSGQNIELDRLNTTPFNNATNLTVLWFKLQQNVSANQSDTNYFLYYGNPSAGAAPANGSNVYLFYDDFEDGDYTNNPTWSVTSGSWSIVSGAAQSGATVTWHDINTSADQNSPNGLRLQIDYRHIDGGSYNFHFNFYETGDSDENCEAGENFYFFVTYGEPYTIDIGLQRCSNGVGSGWLWSSNSYSHTAGTWYFLDLIANSSHIKIKRDGILLAEVQDSNIRNGNKFSIQSYHSAKKDFDNVRISKYLSPEPSVVLLSEETIIPQWSLNASSIPSVYSSTQSQFNITWKSKISMGAALLESNFSGSPKNYSMTYSGGTPWWSSDWSYRQIINITNNNITQVLESGYTVNVTFNHSQLVSQGKSLANGSDVRVLWYDSTSWWNSGWQYRKKLTITNNNLSQVLEQNYTVNQTFDMAQLVNTGRMNATGNDTRIVWWNGTNNVELDRILEPSAGAGFDGSNDYIDVSNSFNFGEGSFVLWIKPTTTVNDFFGNLYSWTTQGSRKLRFDSNKVFFYIDPAGAGGTYGVTSTDALSANQWYLIVATWNDALGVSKIYINGTLQGTGTAGGIGTPGPTFIIGAGGGNGAVDSYFNGIIDGATIFNRALSATEISELYNKKRPIDSSWFNTTGLVGLWHFDNTTSTSVRDSSGNNNHGTQQGGAYYSSGFIVPDSYKQNTLWFKLQKNVSANSFDDNYYVYYGNPSAGAAPANGSNVFLLYDDFNDGNYDGWTVEAGTWTASNGYLYTTTNNAVINQTFGSTVGRGILGKARVKFDYYDRTAAYMYHWRDSNNYYTIAEWKENYVCDFLIQNSTTQFWCDDSIWGGSERESWNTIELIISGNNIMFYLNGQQKASITDTAHSNFIAGRLYWGNDGTSYGGSFDDVIYRKYLSPEPSAALGAEQGQSRYVELDRVNTTAFNNATNLTVLWFKTQTNIPAGSSDANHSLYYGNPSAGAAPANGSNVFLLYDDFTIANTNIWESAGACSITGGEVYCNNGGTGSWGHYVRTIATYAPPISMEYRAKIDQDEPGAETMLGSLTHGTTGQTTPNYGLRFHSFSLRNLLSKNNGNVAGASITASTGIWYNLRLDINNSGATVWRNGVVFGSDNTQNNGAQKLTFENTKYYFHADDIRVRKYLSPEPSAVLLSEQNVNQSYYFSEVLPAGSFYWKSYANNSAGAWNSSDAWYFTISKVPTLVRLFLNGTEGNKNYIQNQTANFTAVINITGKTLYLTTDLPGWVLQSGVNSVINITNLTQRGLFNITAYFPEDQNYSASLQTYFATVIIPGLYDVTVNLALHLGLQFADDTLQSTNQYACIYDSAGWFALIGEGGTAKAGNLSSEYNINASFISDNRAFLGASKGSCITFTRYASSILAKAWLSPLQAFAYAKTNLLQFILKYEYADLLNNLHWSSGTYLISVRNEGYDQAAGKQKIGTKLVK